MKQLIFTVLTAFVLACNSCAPQPAPVPPPMPVGDASPGPIDAAPEPDDVDAARPPSSQRVCLALHAAGCDEADSVTGCAAVIQHTMDSGLTRVPSACLIAAKTKAAVHACGSFVTCPGA